MRASLRVFRGSLIVSGLALVAALLYGGWPAVGLAAVLGVMEVSLSFDNAIVNARVLERMSDPWRRVFLTAGVAIAVVGMRLLLPLVLVCATTGLSMTETVRLAFTPGRPSEPGSFSFYLSAAHPQIAAFGGTFLLMMFLELVFTTREVVWLGPLERTLARCARWRMLPWLLSLVAVALGTTVASTWFPVFIAGLSGLATYALVKLICVSAGRGEPDAGPLVGRAALIGFLYLEVLDASFSFDGTVGAFAITSDPVIIVLGLGCIGAVFVRSITMDLVRRRTLNEYVYLEHGAHWAIGVLAVILLITIAVPVPEFLTGGASLVIIGAAVVSSVVRRTRDGIGPVMEEPAIR